MNRIILSFCLIGISCGAIVISSAHLRLAFTIGTGVGIGELQQKINNVQSRAIKGQITSSDKDFLRLLYRTMAYGAQMTFLLPESARLMHHYLDGSGKPTTINTSLYTQSPRVIKKMKTIRRQIASECKHDKTYTSERFDMGHGKPLDAHFALYFGTLTATLKEQYQNTVIVWTADMPWKWPTNEDIKDTYGTYKKEIFPFPNMLSLIGLGPKMWLPNALGGELAKQGLAKPFEIKTVWKESFIC